MRSKLVALCATLAIGCTAATHSPQVENLATEICNVAFRCCDTGETAYYLGPFTTADNCAERVVRAGELDTGAILFVVLSAHPSIVLPNLAALDRAVEEGRVRVDGDALSLCLQELQTAECNTPPVEMMDPDLPYCPRPPPVMIPGIGEDGRPVPCLRIFVGNVGEGGVCSSDLGGIECAEGHFCRTESELGTDGECVRLGVVGDFCTDDGDCRDPLYCAQLDRTCQEFRTAGQTCAYGDRDSLTPDPTTELLRCAPTLACDLITDTCVPDCERGAQCFGDEMCNAEAGLSCIGGRCDSLRALGLPCGDDDDCQAGLQCGLPADPEPGALPECIETLANGEPCASHSQCESTFCDPGSGNCARIAAPGAPCPSLLDAECGEGNNCDSMFVACTTSADCPNSRPCDTAAGNCDPACVERLADGAMCTVGGECVSDECIADFCRTLPMENGLPCEDDFQCESTFCGLETERVCTELPLPNGARCDASIQCESLVCYSPDLSGTECVTGAGEGDPCGIDFLPCDPARFYCDTDADPPACTALRETGSPCDNDTQCRGSCSERFGRYMCSAAAPADAALCDGSGGGE